MCAVLIGGMDRLSRDYISAAKELGIELKIFTGQENSIKRQIGAPDVIIICTGKISHNARKEALRHAAANSIPLEMIHSSGVSALRRCIAPHLEARARTRCPGTGESVGSQARRRHSAAGALPGN